MKNIQKINSINLNLADLNNESDFQDRLIEVFDLPNYYGRNLDAFWDCLTEIIEPTQVDIQNLNSVPAELRTFMECYLSLLVEYQTEAKGSFLVTGYTQNIN